MNLEISVIG